MSVLALAAAFTSCGNQRDTIFQKPTEFVLNEYPFQADYIDLQTVGNIELTCSQPDYGFAAIAKYSLEVALTDNFSDPEKVYEIASLGSGTQAQMQYAGSDIAIALCALHGFTSSENYEETPVAPIWCRAVCQIEGAPDSRIVSNVIKIDNVKNYFAVREPAFIYCIGNYVGSWIGPEEGNFEALKPYRVTEQIIDSQIYYAEIDFTEAPIFRFYTALTGWDEDSWGSAGGQDNDNPVVDEDFTAGSVAVKSLIKTKDSFSFPNMGPGKLAMTVNMATADAYTVEFKAL